MTQAQTRKQKILGDVKKARRQRLILTTVIIAVLAIGVVAGIILLTPHTPPIPLIGAPISSAMNDQLNGVSNSTLVAVGNPSSVTPLSPESGQPLLLSGNKLEVLYVGAEYCPYCAAERWGLIVALSKFGTFSGLTYMASADSPEEFPDTYTFSFGSSSFSYRSSYNISFVSVEEEHRDHSAFQSPTSGEQSVLNHYDTSGDIPFVDIANEYVDAGGAQFSPGIIAGLNWTQIGSQLNNPSTGIAQAIDGTANTLIQAVCNVDGGQPSSLCRLTLAPPTQAPIMVTSEPSSTIFNTISASDIVDGLSWRSPPRLTW
jgi:hypothetical protein